MPPASASQPLQLTATEHLDLPGGEAVLHRSYLSAAEADEHLVGLDGETNWQQEQIRMYERTVDVPRLSAWYGGRAMSYTYSGIAMQPLEWTDRLAGLKARIEQVAGGACFNSVLLNKYRNEFDGVAWHADDEPELGKNPIIGSISLGATRRFQLRQRYGAGEAPSEIVNVDLHHGDVLIMSGATQHNWIHQIPKKARSGQAGALTGLRINLTFRTIKRFS